MGKEKSSSSKDDGDDKFYGEASEGLSHAEFDRKAQHWAMKNYGEKYGKNAVGRHLVGHQCIGFG